MPTRFACSVKTPQNPDRLLRHVIPDFVEVAIEKAPYLLTEIGAFLFYTEGSMRWSFCMLPHQRARGNPRNLEKSESARFEQSKSPASRHEGRVSHSRKRSPMSPK